MKLFLKLMLISLNLLLINSSDAAKSKSEMVVSVVVLSSCNVKTNQNSGLDLDITIVSQCSLNNDSYITVQNIDQVKINNQYVLSNKENVSMIKSKNNEEYHTQLYQKNSAKESDKVLVTINY